VLRSLIEEVRIDRRASAAELLALVPDILLAESRPLVQELKKPTRTIPIVFIGLGDPVVTGVVGPFQWGWITLAGTERLISPLSQHQGRSASKHPHTSTRGRARQLSQAR
jgi:hypothetical protein